MFCPVCKLEYRPGFTECSDCGVPLVESLDAASSHPGDPENPDAAIPLWTGMDQSAFGAIRQALDMAKVDYRTTSHTVGPLPGLSEPVLAILIHPRDLKAARAALEGARQEIASAPTRDSDGDGDSSSQSPESIATEDTATSDDTLDQPSSFVPDNFNPADATIEVWSGDDSGVALGLQAALRENGIGSAKAHDAGATRISVLPADESRAREIIREVVEATPPE